MLYGGGGGGLLNEFKLSSKLSINLSSLLYSEELCINNKVQNVPTMDIPAVNAIK